MKNQIVLHPNCQDRIFFRFAFVVWGFKEKRKEDFAIWKTSIDGWFLKSFTRHDPGSILFHNVRSRLVGVLFSISLLTGASRVAAIAVSGEETENTTKNKNRDWKHWANLLVLNYHKPWDGISPSNFFPIGRLFWPPFFTKDLWFLWSDHRTIKVWKNWIPHAKFSMSRAFSGREHRNCLGYILCILRTSGDTKEYDFFILNKKLDMVFLKRKEPESKIP